MVVRIHEKAYELVSKTEAKSLLKQQIQSAVNDITNELKNQLTDEIRKEVINDIKANLRCTTSWTNYQAQSQDQIWKYWGRQYWGWKYSRYRYLYSGEHQPYKNGEYSCPTSLNIHYKNTVRKILT